jgi:hypothetical protein
MLFTATEIPPMRPSRCVLSFRLMRASGRIADYRMRRFVFNAGRSIQGIAGVAASDDHRHCQENEEPSHEDIQFLLAWLGWLRLPVRRQSSALDGAARARQMRAFA